ncbi:AMP-binding protein [Pseudodesulfovibrio sp.]|uniref:AMP-binding protein n=1 Tax=unclassified Pseudodesulfovibrio TaxID=2661612 RepID=UPI003B00B265
MTEQPLTLKHLLENAVFQYADRVALGFVDGPPITYARFLEMVRDVATLLCGHGIQPGDKVAIIGENMPHWAVSYFAVTSMGAIAVPILQEFHSSAVLHILRHSEAKLAVASNRYMDKVEGEGLSHLKTIMVMDDFSIVNEDAPKTSFDEALENARSRFELFSESAKTLIDSKVGRTLDELNDRFSQTISGKLDKLGESMGERFDKISESMGERFDKFSESMGERFDKFSESMGEHFDKISSRFSKGEDKKEFQLTPDSTAAILYTSGTTGHSKGVVLTHGNLVSSAISGVKTVSVFETDRFLSVLPMSHTYECTVGLLIPIMCGASVHFLQKPPTPRTLLPAMERVKPTVMNVVPLIIEKIYKKRIKPKLAAKGIVGAVLKLGPARRKASRIAGKKLIEAFGGQLRCLCIGGAAISPEVESFLADSGVPYAIGYGMTEAAPLLAGVSQDRQRFRAIGPSVPGVRLKIDNPDPETGEGEILAKGPNIMQGYYKAPLDTEETFTEDGWLRTGDLGLIDKDGYLFIKGRLKNVIIGPSGENIYPEEIEAIINEHVHVLESMVYEAEGQVCARIHFNYDALDEAFGVNGMIESDVRLKVQAVLEEVRKDVNSKVSSFAKVARVREQVDPFDKTPTHKIKRFVYLDK